MIRVCVQCILYTFTKWSSNCHIVKLFSFPQLPLPTQGSAIYFQHFHLLPYIFGIFICCHIFPWISTPQAITYQPQRGNPKKLGLGEKLEGWTRTVHRKKWRPSIDSWRFLYFFSLKNRKKKNTNEFSRFSSSKYVFLVSSLRPTLSQPFGRFIRIDYCCDCEIIKEFMIRKLEIQKWNLASASSFSILPIWVRWF